MGSAAVNRDLDPSQQRQRCPHIHIWLDPLISCSIWSLWNVHAQDWGLSYTARIQRHLRLRNSKKRHAVHMFSCSGKITVTILETERECLKSQICWLAELWRFHCTFSSISVIYKEGFVQLNPNNSASKGFWTRTATIEEQNLTYWAIGAPVR